MSIQMLPRECQPLWASCLFPCEDVIPSDPSLGIGPDGCLGSYPELQLPEPRLFWSNEANKNFLDGGFWGGGLVYGAWQLYKSEAKCHYRPPCPPTIHTPEPQAWTIWIWIFAWVALGWALATLLRRR